MPPDPASAPRPDDDPRRWTVAEIGAHTERLLGKQGPFRPTVRLVRTGEGDDAFVVAKDYRACVAPYRWTVGVWNLRREKRALARLRGLPGIPESLGRVGRWVLLITWFAGPDLGKARKAVQTPEFFDALLDLVRRMHERGVVHLDLRQRRNVLVGPGRRPVILDFGTALCLRPGGWLLRRLARIDTSGVLKYKRRANPGSLTEQEARILDRVERRRGLWPFS